MFMLFYFSLPPLFIMITFFTFFLLLYIKKYKEHKTQKMIIMYESIERKID